MKNDTVGIYYELPNNKIVFTLGFNNIDETVLYRFEGEPETTVSYKEFQTWKPRKDLRDFPNAKDPRLPYEFDLYWDLKYMSDLKRELGENGSIYGEDLAELKRCVERHNIK